MRCSWIPAVLGSVFLGCGSGASSFTGFALGPDGSLDVRVGADTGVLGQHDVTTTPLGTPDATVDATCSPTVSCTSAGAQCGPLADGCGGMLQCGSCASGTCGGGGTANQCGSACTPTTCAALGFNCGPAGDGCGGSLSCGTCTGAEICGGGGSPSVCGSTSTCVPKTCMSLGFTCGPAGDGCGNSLSCGTCTGNQTCGGGGTPSVCGAPAACVAKTCASLGFTCGPASDGCGGTLQCGTCTAPTACGGGGKPGVCGCTGTCAQIPTCAAGTTTTLTGKVYDPADIHPLYNVLVYVPDNPADPALTTPFAAGVTCDQCGGATAAGNPLVTTNTAYDGTFTLKNIPVGASIPLVIQLGRWRREFTVNVGTSCGANTVAVANTTPSKWLSATTPALPATGHLTMPSTSALGDIPRIAVLSGSFDMVECELRKLGIADSEFVNPGAWGQGNHVQFYQAADPLAVANGWNVPPNGAGTGALISAATPLQTQLFGTDAATGKLNIDQYDLVILECEGYPEVEPAAQLTALGKYSAAGGRLFASDFAYDWLATNPAFQGAANWGGNNTGCGFTVTGTIDPPATNPTSTVFQQWLQLTGVVAAGASTVGISPAFPNVTSVNLPTEEWLYTTNSEYDPAFCGPGPYVPPPIPIHFTFNTPLNAPAANQCGRVTFSDWHATSGLTSQGYTFPAECKQAGTTTTMTNQETILEFMLFDATACVTPYLASCSPVSCAQQGLSCGPAGDGCGGLLNCGTCPAGQTCGGGGTPSVCGAPQCTATTCASQGLQCGPAGDGCGNLIQCGTCPAGQTCGGGGTPGVCGAGTCTAKTCASQGIQCGPAGDGCGNALSCGACPAGQSCGGGGKPGICGSTCTPTTCAALGFNCGPAGDGCGNQLNCGTCVAPMTCGGGGVSGVCGQTIPK